MAKKPATAGATSGTGTSKSRKPRTPIEKVFVVSSGDTHRLVAGVSKRKVEAAVWQRPIVRIATPTDLRELTSAGVLIETAEPMPAGQMMVDAPVSEPAGSDVDAGDSASAQ